MAQPVQYVLRDPFFISSRLMPAVNVADASHASGTSVAFTLVAAAET